MSMQQHDNHIPRDEEIRRILGENIPGSEDWDQPGERVWQGIEESLDAPRRRGAAWWRRTTGILLLLLGLSAGWWLIRESGSAPDKPARASVAQATHSPDQGASTSSAVKAAGPADPQTVEGTPADTGPSPTPKAMMRPQDVRPDTRSESKASGPSHPYLGTPASPGDSPLRAALPSASPLPDPAGVAHPENPAELPGSPAHDRQAAPALAALPLRPTRPEAPPSALPDLAMTLPIASLTPSTRIRHEFGIYGHGNGVSTALRGRQATFRPAGVLSQEQTAYRMGLHYQLVTSRGWLFGTGLDYQRIHENSSREHEIPFTRQGGMPDPQGLAQTFQLAMYGSMGQIRASVPVRVLERMAPLDYQEGETIRLNVDWSQQLDLLRIPLWAGWRQEWRGWFLEGRGGLAFSMPLSYRGDIRQVREFRNRVRIREGSSTETPDGLREIIPEWQAGLRAGIHLPQGWQVHAGWEYWRSWQSVIEHPEYRATLQGQGITLGISKRI